MVQDDQRALIGSYSPLGAVPAGDRLVSVLLEPAEHGPRPVPAVVDLLLWARQHYPYWREGRQVLLHRHELHPDEDWEDFVPVAEPLPLPDVSDDAVIDGTAVRLWAQHWAECRSALADAIIAASETGAAVEAISDGDHRSAFWLALRSARRQVVIADDAVSARAADAAMIAELRARRKAGASVLLLHPDLPAESNAGRQLAAIEEGPGRRPSGWAGQAAGFSWLTTSS